MDLRLKAASFFLCGDNIAEQLDILDSMEDGGEQAPDEVAVWEPFQFDPVDEILTNIENLEFMLQEVWDAAREAGMREVDTDTNFGV